MFSVRKRTTNETLHLSEVKNRGDEAIFRKPKIKTFLTVIFGSIIWRRLQAAHNQSSYRLPLNIGDRQGASD